MVVTKVQTETTYNVDFEESGYTVTVMEDFDTQTIHWDIFDDSGEQVEDEHIIEAIVNVIEQHRD